MTIRSSTYFVLCLKLVQTLVQTLVHSHNNIDKVEYHSNAELCTICFNGLALNLVVINMSVLFF